jgi:hypothetical protein
MLFNAALRFPVVRFFYKGAVESGFLKNLQLIGFYDMGTAWTGSNPLSGDNSNNTTVVQDKTFGSSQVPSYTITVTDYTDPFLRSYGAGFRSMMLGYYMKVDVAKGFVNGQGQNPRIYLTLGYDF